MAEQSDRVVIKFGPGRLDADRAIQREIDTLREEVETKQTNVDLSDYPTTNEVEDIVGEIISEIDVISATPQFLGVPPGLQQFYFAAVVVEDTINLTDTVIVNPTQNNYAFSQDSGNTFQTGTSSVCISTNTRTAIYNFGSGFAGFEAFATNTNNRGIRTGPNFSINVYVDNTNNQTALVMEGGSFRSVTLTPPSGMNVCVNHGISADGNNICAVWVSGLTSGESSTATAVVAEHNRFTGALISNTTPFVITGGTGSGSIPVIIDKGYVVYYSGSGRIFTALANGSPSNTFTLRASGISILSYNSVSQNISSGTPCFYFIYNQDLYRMSLTTGFINVYPDIINRYDTSIPPNLLGSVNVVCMYAISSNKLAYGGYYLEAGVAVPTFSVITLEDAGAAVSDTLFTQYAINTSFESQRGKVYNITRLENGRLIYMLYPGSGLGDSFLLNVAGP